MPDTPVARGTRAADGHLGGGRGGTRASAGRPLTGAGGVEVVRKWLAAHPGRPAVLMSGYDSRAEAVIDALSLGPVMFVKKPIAPADLEAALEMFRQLLPGALPRR